MTPEHLAIIKAKPHGSDVAALIAEVERLWQRERDLLAANNVSLEKARRWEDEANQEHCDAILWRGEVMRLRGLHSRLATFIEDRSPLGEVPREIQGVLDAVFPTERDADAATGTADDRIPDAEIDAYRARVAKGGASQ